jgi:hypothetical protein
MRLQQVRNVLDHSGPFVSLHLDASRDTEDARQQQASRWTSTRHELEHQGVEAAVVEQLGELLAEPTHLPGQVRRTIVASSDGILLDDARTGTTSWPEAVTVGPLPDLAGWLSMVDGQFPFALVRVDRAGADIEMYVAPSSPVAERASVQGDTFDLTKVPEGDWAQDKYQRRAENTWAANARLVADQLKSLDARHRPRLVVLCGDVRACAELTSVLGPVQGAEVVTVTSGGRAAGTSDEALWDDVRRLLDEQRARDTDDLLQQLARGTAVAEGVITGTDRVADALVKGEVERLVLDLEDAHNATVAAADHPGLALPEPALSAGPLPADQVLVAAAALTDAEVSVLPHEVPLPQDFALAQGVAATLRWDERVS